MAGKRGALAGLDLSLKLTPREERPAWSPLRSGCCS